MTMIAPPTPSNAGGHILAPVDPRDQFVALALSVEGLGAAPATLQAYCDLLATSLEDFGDPRARSEEAVMSGCALVVRGLWWRAGVRHKILIAPYRIEHAVEDVIQIARDYGALHGPERIPQRGDVVVITNPVHMITSIALTGSTLTSIDGGQRDGSNLECIRRRDRQMSSTRLDGRPIAWVIDCTAIARAESAW